MCLQDLDYDLLFMKQIFEMEKTIVNDLKQKDKVK